MNKLLLKGLMNSKAAFYVQDMVGLNALHTLVQIHAPNCSKDFFDLSCSASPHLAMTSFGIFISEKVISQLLEDIFTRLKKTTLISIF